MEDKGALDQNQNHEEADEGNLVIDHTEPSTKQKVTKKNKKDHLKQKKRQKYLQKEESKQDVVDHNHHLVKNKSDQDISVATHQSAGVQKSKTALLACHQKSNIQLNRLLSRPTYVSISNSHRISGDYGHSSAIFKRPLIEGNFYLEVMVRDECSKQKKTDYKSSVRVGICHHAYNCSFPLGGQNSIGYKSCDGSFVRDGQKVAQGQSYTTNDVIGILMKISPPHKMPNPKEINKDSSVLFFKNGKLIYQFQDLKQVFYCFAVSFFNYSQVEILQGPNPKYSMLQGARHYQNALNQQIIYKDLQNNRIFKI